MKHLVTILIFLYKTTISPFIPSTCRFLPTCSEYAHDAYHQHNFIKATTLTCKRLLRCRPGGGSGYDPVPTNNGIEAK